MTEPQPPDPDIDPPYTHAQPPDYLADKTPAELAAYGTEDNPWPAPPEGWIPSS